MIRTLRFSPSRQAWFLALASGVYCADSIMVRQAHTGTQRLLIACAASIDLVVVVGFLYYWMLVRPGLRPTAGLIFVAVVGLLRSSFLFPDGVWAKALAAGCAEVGLIAYIAVQIIKSRGVPGGVPDPLAAIERGTNAVIPFPAGARAVAMELSLAYCAMFGWRAKPRIPDGGRAFWLREQSERAFLLAAVGFASVFEIVPVHLLVHRWSAPAAWFLTAAGVYGMIWLLGLSRSLVLYPSMISPNSIDIRYGLIARVQIKPDQISGIKSVTGASDCAVVLPRGMRPNLELSFIQPLRMERLIGSRCISRLALCIEDQEEFLRAVRSQAFERLDFLTGI